MATVEDLQANVDHEAAALLERKQRAPAPHHYGNTIVALVAVLFLLGGLVALFMSSEEGELGLPFSCAGELVPTMCLAACTPSCSTVQQGNCKAPCGPGCACPVERPVAKGNDQCVQTVQECTDASPPLEAKTTSPAAPSSTGKTPPVDFSDCAAPFEARPAKGFLARESISFPEHVRLATAPCPGRADVMLHFSVVTEAKQRTCADAAPAYKVWLHKVGETAVVIDRVPCLSCVQLGVHGRVVHVFAVRLANLKSEAAYVYEIGVDANGGSRPQSREFMSPPLPGQFSAQSDSGLIVGDTKDDGAKISFPVMQQDNPHIVIHVGDASYATNAGTCYGVSSNDKDTTDCGWNSTNLSTFSRRVQVEDMDRTLQWAALLSNTMGGRCMWMTTPGNHDNDLLWFLTYRPPLNGSLPNVAAADLTYALDGCKAYGNEKPYLQLYDAIVKMRWPHFYSFDHGLVHFISLGTEDNPTGAYEMWDGKPLSAALIERFELHYGTKSRQYKWLESDLRKAVARRSLVPWIVLFTHRPMYHTAGHHGMCRGGGDWYGCRFRETYEPLLREYGVNIMLGGHSHHYQRSQPMYMNKVDAAKGTIHAVVGTGGFELTGEDFENVPWIASRQGSDFVRLLLLLTC